MSTQKQVSLTQPYPKAIGSMLWLQFVLLLYVCPKTGAVVLSTTELQEVSGVPELEIEKGLSKLIKYKYVTVKEIDTNLLRIKLKHYTTVNTIKSLPKGRKYLKEERTFTRVAPSGNRTHLAYV